jgi:hypothetical protein
MFISREEKIYTGVCAALLVVALGLGIGLNWNITALLLIPVIVVILYGAGVFVIHMLYGRVRRIREAAEEGAKDIPERYTEGEIGKLSKSMQDMITMLQEAEQKQRREKEFLRDIISDISHQIKTPVAALTVFNDIMLQDAQKNGTSGMTVDEKLEMLEQSELQLERITWLVQSLLQLARIEAESVTFCPTSVDGKALLISCTDVVKLKANEKGQRFEILGDEGTITVDPEWFKEAIINILKNAIDYGPENSTIQLEFRQTPIATRISIRDAGCGIPEEDRLNVFKRFYRVNGSGVNPNSVGIGLALSKSIIEGCGGRIRVESRHISQCVKDEASYTNMVITL